MITSWWRKLTRQQPPLVRTPSVGRPRTYSADSGYVYQYWFAGFRELLQGSDRDIEYVFEVTTGRAPSFPVAIILQASAIRRSIGRERELTASERYGVAKLALKRVLDAGEHPGSLPAATAPDPEELNAIGEILDL